MPVHGSCVASKLFLFTDAMENQPTSSISALWPGTCQKRHSLRKVITVFTKVNVGNCSTNENVMFAIRFIPLNVIVQWIAR